MIAAIGALLLVEYLLSGTRIANAPSPPYTFAPTQTSLLQSAWANGWLDNTRPLMPPMSMMPATKMSDEELKAIFAYLKTTTPVKNVAPQAVLLPPPAAKF
jgi:mono/diheme cytochrome c family protein